MRKTELIEAKRVKMEKTAVRVTKFPFQDEMGNNMYEYYQKYRQGSRIWYIVAQCTKDVGN